MLRTTRIEHHTKNNMARTCLEHAEGTTCIGQLAFRFIISNRWSTAGELTATGWYSAYAHGQLAFSGGGTH